MALWQWSTTAANNASADPTINWQEGQAPSTVNDSARAMMAAIATWFTSPEWLNLGLTPTYASGTQFTVAGNQTAVYTVGRRVRTFNTGGTLYGTVTASAYTTITTVTLAMDSGSMDAGLSEADVGILNPANPSTVPSGRLLNVQVITASGTYTPTTGANSAIVIGSGSGAAAGAVPTTSAGQTAGSSGGGAGAFGAIRIPPGSLAAQTITIGAAGVGTSGAGGNGNPCSFGALMVLPGGVGGGAGTATGSLTVAPVGGPSAAPSGTGTFLFSSFGESGSQGFSGTGNVSACAGAPGSNMFGPGGLGSGGFGGALPPNTPSGNGANGYTGGFVVFEFS